MKYKVLDHVRVCQQGNAFKVAQDLVTECNHLGKAFIELSGALEKLDPNNAALKKVFTASRLKQMKAKYAAEEEKRKKEKERAQAKKAALNKLTHEEKIAFGLVKG